jgi:hypothetical protein
MIYKDESGFYSKTIEKCYDFILSVDGTLTVFTKVKSGTALNANLIENDSL